MPSSWPDPVVDLLECCIREASDDFERFTAERSRVRGYQVCRSAVDEIIEHHIGELLEDT